MKKLLALTTLFFTLIFISNTNAQTVLFSNIAGMPFVSPPPTVLSYNSLDVNLNGLKAFPDLIQLDFPDGTSTTVPKKDFIPRSGYYFRDEEDPIGTPNFWVNPNAADDDFSYKWNGGNADYDVLLTMTRGLLIGYITSNDKRYGIERQADGSYWITDFNLAAFPSGDDVTSQNTSRSNYQANKEMQKNATVSNIRSFKVNVTPTIQKPPIIP